MACSVCVNTSATTWCCTHKYGYREIKNSSSSSVTKWIWDQLSYLNPCLKKGKCTAFLTDDSGHCVCVTNVDRDRYSHSCFCFAWSCAAALKPGWWARTEKSFGGPVCLQNRCHCLQRHSPIKPQGNKPINMCLLQKKKKTSQLLRSGLAKTPDRAPHATGTLSRSSSCVYKENLPKLFPDSSSKASLQNSTHNFIRETLTS